MPPSRQLKHQTQFYLDEEVDAEDAEEDDGGGPQHQDLQHGEDQPGQRQASDSKQYCSSMICYILRKKNTIEQ